MARSLSFSFSPTAKTKADTAVAFILKGRKLTPGAETLDKDSGGLVTTYLKRQTAFTAKKGQTLTLPATAKQSATRLILCGLDALADMTARDAENAGGKLFTALQETESENVTIALDTLDADLSASFAMGILLASYSFEKYRSKKSENHLKKILENG